MWIYYKVLGYIKGPQIQNIAFISSDFQSDLFTGNSDGLFGEIFGNVLNSALSVVLYDQ